MAIVGIDLGTTFSAVAVTRPVPGGSAKTLPGYEQYPVLSDDLKRCTLPSIVWVDPEGHVVVGHRARARMGTEPEPVAFAKRFMGLDRTFQLGPRAVSPEEVSAEVLKELKALAEDVLGEGVDSAVITVPAYFGIGAKQRTVQAGRLAGLQVLQVAQEPVAAAMMYCLGDSRDPLTIMTYDLGGGTFDVAILEKRDGVLNDASIKAFDGDQYLGGSDFDRRLAYWIADQLKARGHDLALDQGDPEGRLTLAKLTVLAERAKCSLSRTTSFSLLGEPPDITDRDGRPIPVDVTVERSKFEELISDHVEDTIRLCWRALRDRADRPIDAGELDEIVMVGGSSRIPLIGRRLEEEFGTRPRLIEPDLCVAIGAAIIAGSFAETGQGVLCVDRVPEETDADVVFVAGRVQPDADGAVSTPSRVTLQTADGSVNLAQDTAEDRGFSFEDVPLARGERTDLILTATDSDGNPLAVHEFSVRQTDSPVQVLTDSVQVLAKPLAIMQRSGLHEIAPARTPIPNTFPVEARTTDQSGIVRVPVYEDSVSLGDILVAGVPGTLKIGAEVRITVEITGHFQVIGEAFIPAVGLKGSASLELETPEEMGLVALRAELERLASAAEDRIGALPAGEAFGSEPAIRARASVDEVRQMLSREHPDNLRIQQRLGELKTIVEQLATVAVSPPWEEFAAEVTQTRDAIAKRIDEDEAFAAHGYDRQLEELETKGRSAWEARNQADWTRANDDLARLRRLVSPPSKKVMSPHALIITLQEDLNRFEEVAQTGRLDEKFQIDIAQCRAELRGIDPNSSDAMPRIYDYYTTKHQPLADRLRRAGDQQDDELRGTVEIVE